MGSHGREPLIFPFGGGGFLEVAASPFPGWLAEVAADAVVVRPEAVDAEARGNLWTFGLSPAQRAAVGPADGARDPRRARFAVRRRQHRRLARAEDFGVRRGVRR